MEWTEGLTDADIQLGLDVTDLGLFTLDFATVPRRTYHADGVTVETDGEHTVMLCTVACALARLVGGLDVGLVAQYAVVHDFPEAITGDFATLRLPTAEQKMAKKAAEVDARRRIAHRFQRLGWVSETLEEYELQADKAARFVKFVDKMLPKILHWANGGVSPIEQGLSVEDLDARYAAQYEELNSYASEWPDLLRLYRFLVTRELAALADTLRQQEDQHA